MHHAGIDFAVNRDAAGIAGGGFRRLVVLLLCATAQRERECDVEKVKVFHGLPLGG